MLAVHGDGTFTVKYASGQTEEDVPSAYVRATAPTTRRLGGRSRNTDDAGAGGGDVWRAVERMASELAKRAGLERRKTPRSSLERETDEVRVGCSVESQLLAWN